MFQNHTPACSCIDCEDSCPVPPIQPPLPAVFMVLGFDGYVFIMTCVFVVGTTFFLVSLCLYPNISTGK